MLNKFLYLTAATVVALNVAPCYAMGDSADQSDNHHLTADGDVWAGNYEQFKGAFKKNFGKLVNDDELVARGNRQEIAGKLQESYGWTKVEAEDKLDAFVKSQRPHHHHVHDATTAHHDSATVPSSHETATTKDTASHHMTVNADVWGGKWKQVKGKFEEKFGKIIKSEKMIAKGNREQIIGKLQEGYGWTKVEAEDKLNEFVRDHTTATHNTMIPTKK